MVMMMMIYTQTLFLQNWGFIEFQGSEIGVQVPGPPERGGENSPVQMILLDFPGIIWTRGAEKL